MRLLLTSIFLLQLSIGISRTSNCEDFSKAYLSVLKSNSLEGFDSFLAPPSAMIERDKLPNTDHFRKVVVHMQQVNKQATKTFADDLRADLKQKGYKLKGAELRACYKSKGNSFKVFVIFGIKDYQDTFRVDVYDTLNYYVTSAPSLKMKTVSPGDARITLNGKTYLKAKANSDHQKMAVDIIKKYLNDQEGNFELKYKYGLIAPNAHIWVLYDVVDKKTSKSRQIMANLTTSECVELD